MAARRLVIVMLMLLFVSTLAAALVPPPESDEEDTATRAAAPTEQPTARTVVRTLDAGSKRTETIRVATGDRLVLTVRSPRPAQVEIFGLGQLEDAAPESPARFDLLLDEPGEYEIRLLASGRSLGRIVAGRAARKVSESRRRAGRSAGTSR